MIQIKEPPVETKAAPVVDGVEPVDIAYVDGLIEKIGREADKVMPLLQAIQGKYRYLPKEALRRVCNTTEITPEQISGVSTFYSQFRHSPMGKHCVQVCRGTACHVKGSDLVVDALKKNLNIAEGDDTAPDKEFTIEEVNCVGCCTLAPVVIVDDVTYSGVSYDTAPDVITDFNNLDTSGAGSEKEWESLEGLGPGDKNQGELHICLDSCCIARGCGDVYKALKTSLAKLGAKPQIKRVSCVVVCEQTPMIDVVLPGRDPIRYARVGAKDIDAIMRRHFKPRSLWHRTTSAVSSALDQWVSHDGKPSLPHYPVGVRDPEMTAFFGPQKHIALEHYGRLDPGGLESYRSFKGFTALEKCVKELTPAQVIEMISESGLRGRGGGGFPTGRKWTFVSEAEGEKKYIVLNGDEGDPGAFMDRMLMESFSFRVLEGMAIAAYAVGAQEGFCYVRAEYPFSVRAMKHAIKKCEEAGLLGDNIFGTKVRLKLEVREGGGAFICGEETALLESIEGRRGIPRNKPPFPAQSGLWGKPTLINNVETMAMVPWIIREGPKEFSKLGTEKSKGTKVFALAGKIRRGGLIEVPMGITLRQIVEEIGGGVPDGKKLKAIQIGGPSGGCVPARLAETPVDYEALLKVGSMMGSGGMIVLDEKDCMVDIARYFQTFTQTESCGQCSYCRIGTLRLLETLDRFCKGKGRKADLKKLEELAHLTAIGSICGLGRTAPNPVLATLKYFPEEYEAHLKRECPGGKCKDLIKYVITDRCIGCTICAQNCPVDAIPPLPFKQHEIHVKTCIECDTCRVVCPTSAIVIQ